MVSHVLPELGASEMVFQSGGASAKLADVIKAVASLELILGAFEANLASTNPDHLAQCPACTALLALRNSKILDELEKTS